MQAARFYAPRDIRVEDIPKPVPKGKQVLVRVQAAGICGSDMHNYRMGMFMTYAPVTMGHEFCGIVCETGSLVSTLQPGDPVVADSRVYCRTCTHCRSGYENRCEQLGFIGEVCDGGFAEYALLEEHQLFVLPAGITQEQAVLLEPLAVTMHIWENVKIANPERLVVVGAGPIGQLVAHVAAALSSAEIVIVEPSKTRRLSALTMGAHQTIHPDEQARFTGRADCVIEAVGKQAALVSAFSLAARGGFLILAGLFEEGFQGDLNMITEKELRIAGINGFRTQNMLDAISLCANKTLDPSPLICWQAPLREAEAAFCLMDDPVGCSGKVVISP